MSVFKLKALPGNGADRDIGYTAVRETIAMDTSGNLRRMVEARGDLPTVETVSVSLIKIIDESTREKEGGQFVHVDGTRLPW